VFVKGQSVAVLNNKGEVVRVGTVANTYPDGATVGVCYEGRYR
jgi:hypothetical protein